MSLNKERLVSEFMPSEAEVPAQNGSFLETRGFFYGLIYKDAIEQGETCLGVYAERSRGARTKRKLLGNERLFYSHLFQTEEVNRFPTQ